MEKSPGKFEDVGKDLRLVLPHRLLGRAADGTIVSARFIFERKSLSPPRLGTPQTCEDQAGVSLLVATKGLSTEDQR